MADSPLVKALAAGFSVKSIGAAESGFAPRWGWSFGTWSGFNVNQQIALQNDTVWACVRKVSDSAATLPLGLYRRGADGSRKPATDLALYDILHNEPNARMSAVTFWQGMVGSMLLWGNAFAEIDRTGERISNLDFLLPDRMSLRRDRSGVLRYFYNEQDRTQREIPRENMLHIPAFTMDGEVGMSAIQYGANSIGSAMAIDKAADETFKESTRASGVITMDAVLSPDQRKDIREHVKTVSKQGGVYVLEKGAGFQSLRFNPADAELLASRSFSVETICRWFDMPPVLIGHGDKQSSWPTSTEAQNALFLRYVLRAIITRIEQGIRRSLLTPAQRVTLFAEFSLEGLLRGDSAARSAFYTTALQNGWMTRNEVRRLENLPPVEGGDILTVQSNMIALADLGKQPGDSGVREALKSWLDIPAAVLAPAKETT